jgi:hypothetical protein
MIYCLFGLDQSNRGDRTMLHDSLVHFDSVCLPSTGEKHKPTFLGQLYRINYHDQETFDHADLEVSLGQAKHKLNL